MADEDLKGITVAVRVRLLSFGIHSSDAEQRGDVQVSTVS